MTRPYPSATNPGMLVDETDLFDTEYIQSLNVSSEEFKNFLFTLHNRINRMSIAINLKDTGYYVEEEFLNSQNWFPRDPNSISGTNQPFFRPVFRKTINFGGLPNASTKSVPHGLSPNSNWSFTRIYATASDTTALDYIPIPFIDNTAASQNIEINVDATNVNIDTDTVDRTNFDTVYVVLEWIKN